MKISNFRTTTEQIIEALVAYKKGARVSEIAEKYNVDKASVYQWLKKAGIKTKGKTISHDWNYIKKQI